MKRTLILAAAIAIAWLGLATAGQAQVFVRAPFVRVGVGDGVYVRAPFVNLYIPGDGSVPPPYGPRVIYMPPPTVIQQPTPPPQAFPPAPQPVLPAPKPAIKDDAPPQPVQPAQVPTLDSFAKTFQAKAALYEGGDPEPGDEDAHQREILPAGGNAAPRASVA